MQTSSTAAVRAALQPRLEAERQDYAAVLAIEDLGEYLIAAKEYFRKWHPDVAWHFDAVR